MDISTPFDSKHYYMFARNTSTLSAAHSVAEGFIRPSASDPNDSSWTTTNSFYACGQHITDITGPHIREAELVSMLMTAQKYGGAGTSLPLTVVGSALSRHNHFCWQRWECINKLPSTSGNPRHCAVVSVRPHFQSFSHIAFFQSLLGPETPPEGGHCVCCYSMRSFLMWPIEGGQSSCLQLIAQRRGLHSWLIWLRDAGVTYLLLFNGCSSYSYQAV